MDSLDLYIPFMFGWCMIRSWGRKGRVVQPVAYEALIRPFSCRLCVGQPVNRVQFRRRSFFRGRVTRRYSLSAVQRAVAMLRLG